MKITLNADKIKGWRGDRTWSQEDLSEVSGLSIRTIQRIENGNPTSRDSAASIAAAFNVDMAALTLDIDGEVEKAVQQHQAKGVLGLKLSVWIHTAAFLFVVLVWAVIDIAGSVGSGQPMSYWFIIPALWWFVGLMGHVLTLLIVVFAAKTDKAVKALDAQG